MKTHVQMTMYNFQSLNLFGVIGRKKKMYGYRINQHMHFQALVNIEPVLRTLYSVNPMDIFSYTYKIKLPVHEIKRHI